MTEQSELEKLQNQNKELERQIALQETLNRANTEQMIKDAEKASKEKITDYSAIASSASASAPKRDGFLSISQASAS